MSADREAFRADGVGCWCPSETTLYQLRLMGHTPECTRARQGWRANNAHLSEIDRQRREDAEVGRQVRESATALLERADAIGASSAGVSS